MDRNKAIIHQNQLREGSALRQENARKIKMNRKSTDALYNSSILIDIVYSILYF